MQPVKMMTVYAAGQFEALTALANDAIKDQRVIKAVPLVSELEVEQKLGKP